MPKYAVRLYCLVEAVVDAEKMEDVMNVCDLNQFDINNVKHQITEINDVMEIEEL
ncbi:TPA: hypothetical protein QB269_000945 [Pasteurella multocida]|nr:hypothetical protein [Pasteurella multocida]